MTHPVLFLGAGASLASGMPSTTAITDAVLGGSGIAHRTWGRYELGVPDPGPGGNDRVEAIVAAESDDRGGCRCVATQ
jgi:hypothetical protein